MTVELQTRAGRQLYRLLPQVYRVRDNGDLAALLDACGELLDPIHATLLQRLDDASPLRAQPWLLPYFADLLDVRLVSPDVEGQRLEIDRAVEWRQRKGTLETAVEIAKAVGRTEVVPQEGPSRVATTARLDLPLLSMRALGEEANPAPSSERPSEAARRPGLAAVTVDVRKCSRARESRPASAISRDTDFGSGTVTWQQQHRPSGVPRAPGSYDDVTPRTVDMRGPTSETGHAHPKRLLLYVPVPEGFFHSDGATRVSWRAVADVMTLATANPDDSEWISHRDGARTCIREWRSEDWSLVEQRFEAAPGTTTPSGRPGTSSTPATSSAPPGDVTTAGRPKPAAGLRRYLRPKPGPELAEQEREALRDWDTQLAEADYLLAVEVRWDDSENDDGRPPLATLRGGRWLDRDAPWTRPPRIVAIEDLLRQRPDTAAPGGQATETVERVLALPAGDALVDLRFERLALLHGLEAACPRVALHEAAARGVSFPSAGQPGTLDARDALLETASASAMVLEHCTVLSTLHSASVHGSDCILLEPFDAPELWLRYTCAPEAPKPQAGDWRLHRVTRHRPLFHGTAFGTPGCAVLRLTAPEDVCFGAEDGGEMGAFHHRHLSLRARAVRDKLREFLPVGIEPVLIRDHHWRPPVPTG